MVEVDHGDLGLTQKVLNLYQLGFTPSDVLNPVNIPLFQDHLYLADALGMPACSRPWSLRADNGRVYSESVEAQLLSYIERKGEIERFRYVTYGPSAKRPFIPLRNLLGGFEPSELDLSLEAAVAYLIKEMNADLPHIRDHVGRHGLSSNGAVATDSRIQEAMQSLRNLRIIQS